MDDFRLTIHETGGPDVITREAIAIPLPAPGEAIVRHEAIGLNFIDTYHRSGLYPVDLPSGLGIEAAGTIEALGDGVEGLTVGQRVAYAGGPPGAYSSVRALPAALLVPVPDGVDPKVAAAAILKGLTVDMLAGPCAKVAPGQRILVHAAAGGVGSLLVPWLKSIGAFVIAHAGSDAKAQRARMLGADIALSCPLETLAGRVRDATGGEGVATVFDGVGKASWDASLASLARRGLMVSYGNASGAVPPVEPLALARAGSVFLTRPTMADYFDTAERRRAGAARLFRKIADGTVPVAIGATFGLDDAAEAHRALAARKTTGSVILLP